MLKPSLQLKLGQTLTMTPQLQQAIRLLQLPVLDLNAEIQEALEENIMLEAEDLPDVPKTSSETTAEVEAIKADDMWQSRAAERSQDSGWNGEGRPISEFADESGQTLREHLLWQVEMGHFSPREVLIAEALVDSINDDGYLISTLDDIAASLDEQPLVSEAEIERTLTKIQHLDPVGAQAAQAVLHHEHDLAPVVALRVYVVAHRPVDLGGDDQFVALARHQFAQDRLRHAFLVDVGAVEEVDAHVTAAPEHRGRRLFVGDLAE